MHLVDSILTQTAEVFRRTPDELVGRSRQRQIVEGRQAAMWAIRQRYPSLSLETIGTALGGRHYTTVMHALGSRGTCSAKHRVSRPTPALDRTYILIVEARTPTELRRAIAPCGQVASAMDAGTHQQLRVKRMDIRHSLAR